MDSETLFLLAKSQGGAVTILATPGAPTTGTWVTGAAALDSNDELWVCIVGGSPGTWTPANADIPLSTVTTKGDLIVATGAGAVTRLPVGTSSDVLYGGATPTWGAQLSPSLSGTFATGSSAGITASTPTTIAAIAPGAGTWLIWGQAIVGAAASATNVDVWIGPTSASTSGYLVATTTQIDTAFSPVTLMCLASLTAGEEMYLCVEGNNNFSVQTTGQVASGLTGLIRLQCIEVAG